MKRFIISFVIALGVPMTFFLGGYNFTEREPALGACFVVTIYLFFFVYFGPWDME